MRFHTHLPVGTASAGSSNLSQASFILLCYWGHPVRFSSLKACLFQPVLTFSSDDAHARLVITVSLEAFQKHRFPDANLRCSHSEDGGSKLRIWIPKTRPRWLGRMWQRRCRMGLGSRCEAPSWGDLAGHVSWDSSSFKRWRRRSGQCCAPSRGQDRHILVGEAALPSLMSVQPRLHGGLPSDREKESSSLFAVRCPDCNHLLKFFSTKENLDPCLACLDWRVSVSQTSS